MERICIDFHGKTGYIMVGEPKVRIAMNLNRPAHLLLVSQALAGLLLAGICPCSLAASAAPQPTAAGPSCPHCATQSKPSSHDGSSSQVPGHAPRKACCCVDGTMVSKSDVLAPTPDKSVAQPLAVVQTRIAVSLPAPALLGAAVTMALGPPVPTLRAQHVCLQI